MYFDDTLHPGNHGLLLRVRGSRAVEQRDGFIQVDSERGLADCPWFFTLPTVVGVDCEASD
jgi:hypothetical protein